MLRIVLSVAVCLVIAAMTLFLEIFAVVMVAGEVSCFEVCSPTWELLDSVSPLPEIAGLLVAVGTGGAASRIMFPPRPRTP